MTDINTVGDLVDALPPVERVKEECLSGRDAPSDEFHKEPLK